MIYPYSLPVLYLFLIGLIGSVCLPLPLGGSFLSPCPLPPPCHFGRMGRPYLPGSCLACAWLHSFPPHPWGGTPPSPCPHTHDLPTCLPTPFFTSFSHLLPAYHPCPLPPHPLVHLFPGHLFTPTAYPTATWCYCLCATFACLPPISAPSPSTPYLYCLPAFWPSLLFCKLDPHHTSIVPIACRCTCACLPPCLSPPT